MTQNLNVKQEAKSELIATCFWSGVTHTKKTALSSRNGTVREVYLCNLFNGQMEDRMFGGLLDHKSGEHLL